MENSLLLEYIHQELREMGYNRDEYSIDPITKFLDLKNKKTGIIQTGDDMYVPFLSGRSYQLYSVNVKSFELISETGYNAYEIFETATIAGTNGATFYPSDIQNCLHIGNIKVRVVFLDEMVANTKIKIPFIRIRKHKCKTC